MRSNMKRKKLFPDNSLPNDAITIQLHCFVKASRKAYGTIAYLWIQLNGRNIISRFVAPKSRVAPLKTISIPSLELMGALLTARMSNKIVTALSFPVSGYFWTLINS
ncbi:hypothetical protein X975_11053, partial [Stegodyphus mimosarum]